MIITKLFENPFSLLCGDRFFFLILSMTIKIFIYILVSRI
ncbi:putative membrane protein [Chlamydia psittaci 02DC15]|nr:putative membrane protein [Chlamydia psittaci NJ1]EPJ14850.1 putative membrane protein [Chlamydia psittaci 02DC15]EPP31941.1 putative membrane protein [Chlamydia psittaci C1/97]EPP37254.1 putative membrane protein [Chlamydia psittaci 84-8471/1]